MSPSPVIPVVAVTATPLEAVGLGLLAGLFATCALSLLTRLSPGMGDLTLARPRHRGGRAAPRARDLAALSRWQDRSRSPAAYGAAPALSSPASLRSPLTPEGALVTDHGPGPEGAAERFAAKLVAGLFDRDLLQREKLAGKVVHFVYGSLWGGLYGVLQVSLSWPWALAGLAHGALVWLVGPGLLVPAMKVMLSPRQLGAFRTTMVIVGHLVYGLLVALLFMVLLAERRP